MVNVPTSTMDHHRVRVHLGACRFISTATIRFTVPRRNSRLASLSMPCGGALGDSDQSGAVADDLVVSTLPRWRGRPACPPYHEVEPAKRCQR